MLEDHKRLVANLRHEAGFVALCNSIKSEVDALTEDLQNENDTAAALRKLRVWQVTRRLVNVLANTPEALAEEIRLEENRPMDEHLPFFGCEEDPFSRRPPIPPPVSK